MAEQIFGRIAGITCYPEKGKDGTPLRRAQLRRDWGMEGDFHAGNGNRQLSLLSREVREWIDAQEEQGLCFSRFKENLSIDGIAMERLHVGARLKAGEAVLEISGESKHCYPECALFSEGRACRLSAQGVFAKVIESGGIRVGDAINLEDEQDGSGVHTF